jgi:hypothetical protein
LTHLERIKDERPDIAPPCTFEFVYGFGIGDTCNDYKSFFLEGED